LTIKLNVAVAFVADASFPVPVTVRVYVPGVVPEFVVPFVELPPQPTEMPMTVNSKTAPNADIDFRRLPGIPKHVTKKRTATVPKPLHSFGPGSLGQTVALLLAPVVVTDTVTVAVVVPELSVAVPLLEQFGGSTAPLGPEVTAQVNVMVPA
jgi:hypothetical protein